MKQSESIPTSGKPIRFLKTTALGHIFHKKDFNDIYSLIPDGIYLFKVNYRNTLGICAICSKLIVETTERQ